MNLLERIVYALLLSCVAVPAFADPELLGTVSGGQKCTPINEKQAEYFERRRDGIWNLSAEKELWVVCPIELPYAPVETVCPSLGVSNQSEVTAEVHCVFREIDFNGNVLQAIANGPALLEPGATHFVNAYWWDCKIPAVYNDSSWSVSCLLPPKTGIRRVYSLYFESTQ